MKKIFLLLSLFLFVLFVTFFMSDFLFLFSEKQRQYYLYEKPIVQKTETILEHLLPQSAFKVVATVQLSHEVIKESSVKKIPHLKTLNDVELKTVFEKNRDYQSVIKEENRDYNQPGFSEIMPQNRALTSQKNVQPILKDSEQTHKNEKIEDQVFIDTLTQEKIHEDNMLKQRSLFVLLDKRYDLSISIEQLKQMLAISLGFNLSQDDIISIQEITFYPKKSWLTSIKNFFSPYLKYFIYFFAALFLLFVLFLVYLMYQKTKNKEDKKDEILEVDTTESIVSFNEKKEQLLELAKSHPEQVSELIRQWMKK